MSVHSVRQSALGVRCKLMAQAPPCTPSLLRMPADILGVPRSGGAPAEPPKPKEKLQRPAGMSREAFALLDGAHPVVPAALAADLQAKSSLAGLKEKRKSGPPKGQACRPAPAPATTVRCMGAGRHGGLITRLERLCNTIFATQRRSATLALPRGQVPALLRPGRQGPCPLGRQSPACQGAVQSKRMRMRLCIDRALQFQTMVAPLLPACLAFTCGAVAQAGAPPGLGRRVQVTWQWRRFANPARADGLQLQHWVKCRKELATGMVKPVDAGEYQFAKYNKKARAGCRV